mmetsp:Transcript_7000/g.14349  ORF Transcript_7000/g.14349 Transcript_7000/m.14349 type:complete len:297 (-) Transcript_7000:273-1163(-)
MQDGKVVRHDGSAVGDRTLFEGHFEGQIQIGWAVCRLHETAFHWSIDHDTKRSFVFAVLHNEDNGLMKDTTEPFIGNQDATGFQMGNFVRPTVLVDLRFGNQKGQFGFADKGVIVVQHFHVFAVLAAVVVVIVVIVVIVMVLVTSRHIVRMIGMVGTGTTRLFANVITGKEIRIGRRRKVVGFHRLLLRRHAMNIVALLEFFLSSGNGFLVFDAVHLFLGNQLGTKHAPIIVHGLFQIAFEASAVRVLEFQMILMTPTVVLVVADIIFVTTRVVVVAFGLLFFLAVSKSRAGRCGP